MSKTIVFLFNRQDAVIFVKKFIFHDEVVIYASGLSTINYLNSLKVKYRRLNHFIPLRQNERHYVLAQKLASTFNPTIYASVRLFFLELLRCRYLNSKLLSPRPHKIIINDHLNQFLTQKYFTETCNLLPQTIIRYCQKNNITVEYLDHQTQNVNWLKLVKSSFLQNIRQYIKSLSIKKAPILGNKNRTLVSASGYHIDSIIQTAIKLVPHSKLLHIGKLSPHHSKIFRENEINHLDINRFVYPMDIVKNLILQLIAVIKPSQPSFSAIRIFDSLPKNISSCVCKYWNTILIPQNAILYKSALRLFKYSKPKILISSNSIDNFNRTIHLAAKKLHIHSSVILHYPMSNSLDAIEENSGIQDMLYVHNRFSANLLKKYKYSLNISLIKYPRPNGINMNFKPSAQFHDPLRLLFLLCQDFLYLQNYNDQIIQEILNELNKYHDNVKVTLRQHPQETPLNIKTNILKFPVLFDNASPLTSQLNENDIIITQGTTAAAIQAMALHKPLIYLNTQSIKNFRPYATAGAARSVYRSSQLIPIIDSLVHRPRQLAINQKRFLFQYCSLYKQPLKY